MEETMHEYVARHGYEVHILKDRGTQVRNGWEHHAYDLELWVPVHEVRADFATMEMPWTQGLGIETSPENTPAEVLDCLVSDAWSVEQAQDLPDWAQEFGYEDIRDAWDTYHACERIRDDLTGILGGKAELEYLALEVERL